MKDTLKQPNYFEISTIVFDHKLNNQEILVLKDILFTEGNRVSGLYFKETIDYNSIEIIKYLTEISPYVNDNEIEKYILLDNVDYETIMDMSFENIDTWNISYNSFDSRYKLTSISNYREMETNLRLIIDSIPIDYSDLEKIAFLYNKTKLLDYDENYNDLPNIVIDKKASNLGYNLFFKALLDKFSIKSTIICDNNNYITLIDIKDSKYNVDGIYLFDPMKDSISKEKYQVKDIRNINFNYFGLRIKDYNDLTNNIPSGLLLCLSHDLEYDLEKYNSIDTFEKERLFTDLKNDFDTIHERCEKTDYIKDETIISLMDKVIDKDGFEKLGVDINSLLVENYLSRKDNIKKEVKIKKVKGNRKGDKI